MKGLIPKLENDFARAELSKLDSLLARVPEGDFLTRLSLQSQRDEVANRIAGAEETIETTASAALFFGGAPVIGTEAIEAEFAGKVLAYFQELVSKIYASQVGRPLNERGPPPQKPDSTLHITNLVRGSFGFLLEEARDQQNLLDSALKVAVERATNILHAFAASEENTFQEAIVDADQRVLVTARHIFDLLKKEEATVRVVAGDNDFSLGHELVNLAASRAKNTAVRESEQTTVGELTGVLPKNHEFEFRAAEAHELIYGTISTQLATPVLEEWNRKHLFIPVEARFHVKTVLRKREVVRQTFTLLDLSPIEGRTLTSE